jgi:hypothetical protein
LKNIIFIRTTLDKLNGNYIIFSSNSINISKEKFGDDSFNLTNISYGIISGLNRIEKLQNVTLVRIKDIVYENNFVKIIFEKIPKDIQISGRTIYSNARTIIEKSGIKIDKFLPYISFIPVDKVKELFDCKNSSELDKIIRLKNCYKWQDIYNLFKNTADIENNSEIWNDASLLFEYGFAASKLSETSCERKITKNIDEYNKFLENQKHYRDTAKMLYKRCMELDKSNIGYMSSYAYMFYKDINELTSNKGRRDEKLYDKIKYALKLYDSILIKSPDRIVDLYRKARIISKICDDFYSFKTRMDKSNYELAAEAISLYKRIDYVYNNNLNENEKLRYKDKYIKSLYDMANLHLYIAVQGVNDVRYIFLHYKPQESIIVIDEKYYNFCITNLKYARTYYDTAINNNSNNIENVFLFYKKAQTYYYEALFNIFQKNFEDKSKISFIGSASESEKWFFKAINEPFSDENKNQNKNFIFEKLAMLYILKGEFEKAVNLIIKNIHGKPQGYILRTLALALYLSGNCTIMDNNIIKNFNQYDKCAPYLLFIEAISKIDNNDRIGYEKIIDSLTNKYKWDKTSNLLVLKSYYEYKMNNIEKSKEIMMDAFKISGNKKIFIKSISW